MKSVKEIARYNTTSGLVPVHIRISLNERTNTVILFGYVGPYSLKCDYQKDEVLIDRFVESLMLLADREDDDTVFDQIRNFLMNP
jgi:hypothetical protein